MNKSDIVKLIRDFEYEEGEAFFSRITNVIDNKDFLKWLKTKYPKVYNAVECYFFEPYDVDWSFEDEIARWDNTDMMEYIIYGLDEYTFIVDGNNSDDTKAVEFSYNIIAEYILEDKTNTILNNLQQRIIDYQKSIED